MCNSAGSGAAEQSHHTQHHAQGSCAFFQQEGAGPGSESQRQPTAGSRRASTCAPEHQLTDDAWHRPANLPGARLRLDQLWGAAPPHAVVGKQAKGCLANCTSMLHMLGRAGSTPSDVSGAVQTRLTQMARHAVQGRGSRTGFGQARSLCGRSASISGRRSCSSGRCRSRGWWAATHITAFVMHGGHVQAQSSASPCPPCRGSVLLLLGRQQPPIGHDHDRI